MARTRRLGARLASFLPLMAMAWFSLVALAVRARRDDPLLQYGGGLLAAAVIALALYIPMSHYAEINPDEFWNRTRGRMFGEQAFVRARSSNRARWRLTSRRCASRRNVSGISATCLRIITATRCGCSSGKVTSPGSAIRTSYPALDGVAGGLLILGLVVWGVLMARQRDPVLWLLPVGVC